MFGRLFVRSRDRLPWQDSARPEVASRDAPVAVPAGWSGSDILASKVAPISFSVGNMLYLVSIGLVAGTTAATFLGTGFLLLIQPAGGTPSGGGPRSAGTELKFLGSSLVSAMDSRRPGGKPGPVPAAPPILRSGEATVFAPIALLPVPDEEASPEKPQTLHRSAALSSAAEALPSPAKEGPSARETPAAQSTERAANSAPAHSAGSLAAAPVPAIAPILLAPRPGLPAAEITELLGQGDALLRTGDVASARLFYQRVANAGDGRGALRLGATFDPAFLGRSGLGNLQGNAAEARAWYTRALDLGAAEAKRQVDSLEPKQGR